ncbi:MAG: GNVR domain-containing protein [Calditrichia bacterium]
MEAEEKITPFFNFIKLIWSNRKKLLIINGSAILIALIISLLLPKWYEGRVVFIVNEDSDLTGSLASSVLGNVGLPAGLLGIGSTPVVDQYINFLGSYTILNKIDSLYNLQEDYKTKFKTLLYKKILQNANFINNGDNTITIKFYYKEDPKKAAAIANSFYEELNKLVNNLKQERNKNIRLFLENTYNRTVSQLNAAEEELSKFQIKSNLYLPEEQTKLAVQTISELESEKIKLEIQKVYLDNLGAKFSSEYKALLQKMKALKDNINSLKSDSKDYDLTLEQIPEKGLEYLRLYREVKIREKILEFVVPQLENARLEEQRKTANLQILDKAVPQDYKAKPKRAVFIFVIAFFSIIISLLYYLIRDFIKNNHSHFNRIFKSN